MWEGLTSSYLEIEVSAVDLFILRGGQKKKKGTSVVFIESLSVQLWFRIDSLICV